jgi:hypothetical protein
MGVSNPRMRLPVDAMQSLGSLRFDGPSIPQSVVYIHYRLRNEDGIHSDPMNTETNVNDLCEARRPDWFVIKITDERLIHKRWRRCLPPQFAYFAGILRNKKVPFAQLKRRGLCSIRTSLRKGRGL